LAGLDKSRTVGSAKLFIRRQRFMRSIIVLGGEMGIVVGSGTGVVGRKIGITIVSREVLLIGRGFIWWG
jgi:hypothetical protein